MSRILTISVSERAYEIIQQFAWGQKSRVLSDYIETLETPKQQIANPEKVLPDPIDKKLRTEPSASINLIKSSAQSSTFSKTSREAEASAKQQSITKSLATLKKCYSAGQ